MLPQEEQRLRQQADLHVTRREFAQAIAAYERLEAAHPNDANVLLHLSYAHSLAGHYRAAREYALKTQRARPRDPAVLREMFSRLRTFNAVPEMHEAIDHLRPLSNIPIPVLLAAAAQFSYLNEQTRALALLDEARRADPDFPPTLVARAQILTYLGRFDEAEAEVLRSHRRAPEIPHGWTVLARVRKQTRASNHVDAIRAQLRRPGRKPDEIAMLADALHKELDDIGDYEGAWAALEQMCRAKRPTLSYSREETRRLFDALIDFPPGPVAPATPSANTPIFIVGMHRSGTTLLEQLLDGHRDVHGVGELYDFTTQMRWGTDHHCPGVIDEKIVARARDADFAAIGQGYREGMAWRVGDARWFTDKLPSNFLNIGFICRALPDAKILHMVRDPMETCFSNLRELFSTANAYSYDQGELADFHHQYRRLMAHWHAAFPGRILDVDYAALTRDTERVLREVSSFCGFPYEPEMLALQNRTRGVSTASAVQVRGKVEAREVPKWAPYEARLQTLIEGLRGA